MTREVFLRSLRDVAVLFPSDLHDLAAFVLKARDARDGEANAQNPRTVQRSRPTMHGLAAHYTQLTGISRDRIERILVEAGFDLGAVVEFDPADSADAAG